MGLFSKPVVACNVCGREIGGKEKRWATKDGFLCLDCQKPFGILNGSKAFVNYSSEQISEMREKRIAFNDILIHNKELYDSFKSTRVIEKTLYIDDTNEKWYYDNEKGGIMDINGNTPVPLIFDFSDILEVYVSSGGKTISSTSSTRKLKGIRKAAVGGIIAGSTGALLGGMMARTKTETHSIINQDIFVNVILDGASEPFPMQYITEQSAEIVHHVLASLMKDAVDNSNIPAVENNVKDIPNEIRKFKTLFDEGIITQEEFNSKKKQLLDL